MPQPEKPNQPSKPAPPPPANGPLLGQPGGARRGFIPPTVHRQKVEAVRADPIPMAAAPPVVEPPLTNVTEPMVIEPVRPMKTPEPEIIDAPITVPAIARRSRWPFLLYYGGGLIAGACLLISALIGGFWLHSFGAIDRAIHATTAGQYDWVESWHGAVYWHAEHDPNPVERELDVWRFEFGDPWAKKDPPPKINGAATTGITTAKVPLPGSSATVTYWVISYWLLVLVPATPGIIWLVNRKKLRARCRRRQCTGCGHDLDESSHRCPACGMSVEA